MDIHQMVALTQQHITDYYRWLLEREPEPEVIATYLSAGVTRTQLVQTILQSGEFAERRRRADASAPVASSSPSPGVRDSQFWRRYVPFWNPRSPVPFVESEFQTFVVPGADGEIIIKSMLSSLELSLLYALARDHWTGEGEIVDLGCLYGLTTRCLAEGAARNDQVPEAAKGRRIYAYDLFLAEDFEWWSLASPTVHAGSWFTDFLRVNHAYLPMLVPCPGDLLRMNWGSRPIEILMVDAAKSWDLNGWVIRKLFPRLIPGKSVVVQQDQVHYLEYWISIAMEYFSDKFEYIDTIYGSSAFYLCKAPITEDEARVDLKALPFREKERLLLAAIARGRPSLREALKGTYVKLLLDCEMYARAREVLEGMSTERLSEDEAYDFSAIARTDKASLLALLETGEPSTRGFAPLA
ncbi:hypothetical protein [Methylobacterium planeticum]|uniref:Uncharacterized protein n=1 Tax=Methylobacterium planeticum TaxID=2615211 RepID=A0A6N6MV24_9HYPH|nr:hypothetical protein [Methylobacterium planeticum]KAB1075334.1 hypothetical protein F6X51_05495 [Methylobacterium planeticum]